MKPDRLHLTLYFFGDTAAETERRLLEALREPLRCAPFHVRFGGLGFFPERGTPRVLWMGVRAGTDDLRKLHGLVVERIDPASTADPESPQSFTPHLTLARCRDRVQRAAFGEIQAIGAETGPTRIDRVTLYESRLSPAGPDHIRLAEALLTP